MPGGRGPVPIPLRDGSGDVTQQILDSLEDRAEINTSTEFSHIPQNEIKAALDRLRSRQMIDYQAIDSEHVLLTQEGQKICDEGSHEWKVWDAVRRKGGIEIKDLAVSTRALASPYGLAPTASSNLAVRRKRLAMPLNSDKGVQ